MKYVQDQVASGLKKALIVMNHLLSEQSGMRYCADSGGLNCHLRGEPNSQNVKYFVDKFAKCEVD